MNWEVWIKRRFFPGFRKFECAAYKTEILGETARLSMLLAGDVRIAIPRVDRRELRVYPIERPEPNPDLTAPLVE